MLVGMSTDPGKLGGSPQILFAEVRLENGCWWVENSVEYDAAEGKTPHEAAKKYLSEVCRLRKVNPLRPWLNI